MQLEGLDHANVRLRPQDLPAALAFYRDLLAAGIDNIEAVLCGHVHRPMVKRWAGTVVCAAPSTVTQIDLKLAATATPSSHAGPRACMLHVWNERDGLVSHVSQIGEFAGPYPFA